MHHGVVKLALLVICKTLIAEKATCFIVINISRNETIRYEAVVLTTKSSLNYLFPVWTWRLLPKDPFVANENVLELLLPKFLVLVTFRNLSAHFDAAEPIFEFLLKSLQH